MRFKEFYLKEASGQNLIIVDIQPSYKKAIKFSIESFCEHLIEEDYNKILYLYNGPDLGMENSDEIMNFLIEEGLEYDEEKVEQMPHMTFYEKGYAFYRDMMDSGYDYKDIVKLIKYMISKKYNTSEDLGENEWITLKIDDPSPNRIFIPDVLDELKKYNNIVLCGGGKNECLAEIEICLDVLGKPYTLLNKFVY